MWSQHGFYPELNEQVKKEACMESLPISKQYIALVIDEMKIEEDFVYDKHTG